MKLLTYFNDSIRIKFISQVNQINVGILENLCKYNEDIQI